MRYLCIHSHFYQPPRENPWLEAIELQDSAYPYHDWNERVTAECYAPNAAARILDGGRLISQIVNNYSQISFNFGPTLLSWMQKHSHETYESILHADRESLKTFSGHGSAIAQAYNHMIMPLAKSSDKWTQILWGYEDFVRRFDRPPEGMWLPETAVDLESLDLMAKAGLQFTILAQHQAKAIRPLSETNDAQWTDVTGSKIDPSRAYVCKLPSGRSINCFFYDGPVSQAVAFEKLLDNGEKFANRLIGGFSDARTWPQLMHIATDGETYGHHHRHGEMALAYALEYIQSRKLAKLTNYGEFLELNPPTHEVQIYEDTAWSCVHGVERWQSNCGCNSGRPFWNQEWRKPLREALDWLRDLISCYFEKEGTQFLYDPWAARDAYISVLLDSSVSNRQRFALQHFTRPSDPKALVSSWKLLEMQRHAMLMYTSCGWFFDELSGIETVQVIQYAGRVVQLFERLFAKPLEADFLDRLVLACSNVPDYGNGAEIYRRFVKPSVVDLNKVGAHYAISSLFETYPEEIDIYSYWVKRIEYHAREAGKLRLAVGTAQLVSKITEDSQTLTFGVVHFGDHNIVGAVRPFGGSASYNKLLSDMTDAFSRAETPDVLRLLDRAFGEQTYSLRSLFRDEQRRILDLILDTALAEADNAFLDIYRNHAPLVRFVSSLGTPMRKEFTAPMEHALNSLLRQALSSEELDEERVRGLLSEARYHNVVLDTTTLEFTLRRTLEKMAKRFAGDPTYLHALDQIHSGLAVVRSMPFHVHLWSVQNCVYDVYVRLFRKFRRKAEKGDIKAQTWLMKFESLARLSDIKID
jgi:alpha-amylase/alpha-mannosidase (GH57 family)